MNVKIHDLMQTSVVTLQRHSTVADARALVQEKSLSSIPITGSRG